MANFTIVVSDPQSRKSYQIQLEQDKGTGLVGKKLNDDVSGDIFGLVGYSVKITGGSDRDGFPMHPSVPGQSKKRVLLTEPPGFHPKLKGQRKRKTVRGNTISQDISQINVKVTKGGSKPLEEIFGKKEESKAEEKPAEKKEEAPKEPAPAEVKKEEPKKEEPVKQEEEKADDQQKETGGEGSTEEK